jgi:hypothetical protein
MDKRIFVVFFALAALLIGGCGSSPSRGVVVGAVAISALVIAKSFNDAERAKGYTECRYTARKSGTDGNGTYTQRATSKKRVRGYKADCN